MLSICAAPIAGCPQGGGLIGGGNGNNTSDVGLFINETKTDGLLTAAKARSGDEFFVFGTRDADGDIGEIESIVARGADGSESFIAFESGRPVHAQGADGSYVNATYDEVSDERLAGSVELYDAATGEKSNYNFDVDLTRTAAEVAAQIRTLTGRDVQTPTAETAKSMSSEQVRITIFSPLYLGVVVPLAAAVALTTIILGQILVVMYALVIATVQAVLLTIYAPLFLIAAVLSETIVRVNVGPIRVTFDDLPTPPVIIRIT